MSSVNPPNGGKRSKLPKPTGNGESKRLSGASSAAASTPRTSAVRSKNTGPPPAQKSSSTRVAASSTPRKPTGKPKKSRQGVAPSTTKKAPAIRRASENYESESERELTKKLDDPGLGSMVKGVPFPDMPGFANFPTKMEGALKDPNSRVAYTIDAGTKSRDLEVTQRRGRYSKTVTTITSNSEDGARRIHRRTVFNKDAAGSSGESDVDNTGPASIIVSQRVERLHGKGKAAGTNKTIIAHNASAYGNYKGQYLTGSESVDIESGPENNLSSYRKDKPISLTHSRCESSTKEIPFGSAKPIITKVDKVEPMKYYPSSYAKARNPGNSSQRTSSRLSVPVATPQTRSGGISPLQAARKERRRVREEAGNSSSGSSGNNRVGRGGNKSDSSSKSRSRVSGTLPPVYESGSDSSLRIPLQNPRFPENDEWIKNLDDVEKFFCPSDSDSSSSGS